MATKRAGSSHPKKSGTRARKTAPKKAAKRAAKKAATKATKKAVKKAVKKAAGKGARKAANTEARRSAPRTLLKEYDRKRDFAVTAEPAGEVRATKRRRHTLRFVIQKHAASHLHFDLRLECDGVMKSWAVPKGPSLSPGVRRLAMQVEDHPIAYNTFEGTIPRGEYGGGTVMLWDHGTYAPVEGADDANATVHRQLEAGKLVISFDGERMKGRWHLVRAGGDDGDGRQWLFIKGRDEFASAKRDIVADEITSVDTGRTMDEIAGDADRVWRSNRR